MHQAEMRFAPDTQFADLLREGQFAVINQFAAPALTQDRELAFAPFKQFMSSADSRFFSATLMQDRLQTLECHPISSLADEVLAQQLGSPIVTLTGKGQLKSDLLKLAGECYISGVRTFFVCTGDHRGVENAEASVWTDSLEILELIKSEYPDCICGVAFNPFKYDSPSSLPVYAKLLKKLQAGADFIVTEFGWDMAKFQELQWFLRERELDIPVFAGLLLPKQSQLQALSDECRYGPPLSRNFSAHLQREALHGMHNSRLANLQRMAMQVEGLMLMGFSGVMLGGVNDTGYLRQFRELWKVPEFNENGWQDWLTRWNTFHEGLRFAPEGSGYYRYQQLMDPEFYRYSEEVSVNLFEDNYTLKWYHKWRYRLAKALHLDRWTHPAVNWVQRLLFGSVNLSGQVSFLPVDYCPKRLSGGVCGDSKPGGVCEIGRQRRCLYAYHFSYALWSKQIDKLEE